MSAALSTPNSSAMTASLVSRTSRTRCLDRVLQHQIDRANHMRLTDSIGPTDALFYPHRIPWHVEIDDDMAELQVQAFAAGVCGDHNAHIA